MDTNNNYKGEKYNRTIETIEQLCLYILFYLFYLIWLTNYLVSLVGCPVSLKYQSLNIQFITLSYTGNQSLFQLKFHVQKFPTKWEILSLWYAFVSGGMPNWKEQASKQVW